MKKQKTEQPPMEGLTVEFTLRDPRRERILGSKKTISHAGKVPRLTRLMALAIKFDGMVSRGEVRDYADLARLGYVTRARVTQIMNLSHLAPDIQEAILFLPSTVSGRDPISERSLRKLSAIAAWRRQRKWFDERFTSAVGLA